MMVAQDRSAVFPETFLELALLKYILVVLVIFVFSPLPPLGLVCRMYFAVEISYCSRFPGCCSEVITFAVFLQIEKTLCYYK